MKLTEAKKLKAGDTVWVYVGPKREIFAGSILAKGEFDSFTAIGGRKSIIFQIFVPKRGNMYVDHLDIANNRIYGDPKKELVRELAR
jgi:hypothetical protein